MKFQNLLLCASLVFGSVISKKVDYAYTTDDFKYNFYCLKDNKGICNFLESELKQAIKSITKIIDFVAPVQFEAFVDDLSKYRINTKKETLALLLNNEFIPINTKDTTKDNNIKSPYPNSKALLKKINNGKKNNDFILVLNNFISDKKYLDKVKSDFDSSIIMEVFDGLKVLNKVEYPYNTVSLASKEKDKSNVVDYGMVAYFQKRLDGRVESEAIQMTNECRDYINLEKLHTIIHWEDTLIANDKSIGKKQGRSVGNPKNRCHIVYKNKYERIVVVGDIHGDYEHLISILRHAKLINKKNKWIGKKAILLQIGDLIDRGKDSLKVFEFMMDLREQAKKKGGIVYLLMGNHEIIALQGNHHFTSSEDNEIFGDYKKREAAFGPDRKLGKYIREQLNMTMIIDDTIFSHAGLKSKYIENGVDFLNERARRILKSTPTVEELYQMYAQHNITHEIFTDEALGDDGPASLRDFANKPEEVICPEVEKTLKMTNTKRMVIGHNPQSYGKIRTKCQNKLIIVDIGISRCIGGGYKGYLEILNKKQEVWARYMDNN